MKTRRRISLLLLIAALVVLCSGPAFAQFRLDKRFHPPVAIEEPVDSPEAARDAMVQTLISIEQAMGLSSEASQGIDDLDATMVNELFSPMKNRQEFINAAANVRNWILEAGPATGENGTRSTDSFPFSPNYPTGASYQVALLFGLVDSPDDRCGGPDFDNYEAFFDGVNETMRLADAACLVAGCDPTGIGCGIACGAVEVTKQAFLTAAIPLNACKAHGEGVDSAEIEAGFENSVRILSDIGDQKSALDDLAAALAAHDANIDGDLMAHDAALAAHDANIDGDLADHDARIAAQVSLHDADIKALLANILANQAEIIKLLKTPEGRRPGWNKEGY